MALFFYFSSPNEPQFTKQGQLSFINKDAIKTIKTIDNEIADNDAKMYQGLVNRRSMPDNCGMLFIFLDEKSLSFWMKDTYIPLDLLFINKAMEIVTIRENTTPLSEAFKQSEKPAQYVVEVNAGFCRNNKISPGDKIKFDYLR